MPEIRFKLTNVELQLLIDPINYVGQALFFVDHVFGDRQISSLDETEV